MLSYLGVGNIHQGEVRRLVLVHSISIRDSYNSRTYRFLIAILLLALLEASFKFLNSEVKGSIILKPFSKEHILCRGEQQTTRDRKMTLQCILVRPFEPSDPLVPASRVGPSPWLPSEITILDVLHG